MAIIMAKNNSWAILHTVLGDTQPFQKAKYLQSIGADFKVGLFSVTVIVGGKEFTDTMPVSISLFPQSETLVQSLIKSKVSALIEQALVHSAGAAPANSITAAVPETPVVPAPAATPAWMNSIPTPPKEVKAAQAAAGTAPSPAPAAPIAPPVGFEAWAAANPSTPAKPKPTQDVMKLKDARALSQQVYGTSPGSVYRVAAIGKVNVAIREQHGTVSVRAEFQGKSTPDIAAKLTGLGFTSGSKGEYWSMHISLTDGAPCMRVVGSILLGAGIEFEQIATTSEQINNG